MTKKNKLYSLILLLVLAILAAFVAGTSVSRYVFDHDDTLHGSFTNLYFSHNGEGATAIMQPVGADDDYVGYISLTAFNWENDDVSARHIKYTIRAVTSEAEKVDGRFFVRDAWGVSHELSDAAAAQRKNYSVVPVKSDMTDYSVTESETETSPDFEEGQGYQVTNDVSGKPVVTLSFGSNAEEVNGEALPVEDSRTDILKITRHAEEGSAQQESFNESFYIIIEITQPYREIEIFKVNTSTRLIAVGHTSGVSPDTHFGYSEIAVNVQTARSYSYQYSGQIGENNYNNENVSSLSPAKIEITWTSSGSSVIFDSGRLAINSENNIKKLNAVPADTASWLNGWFASSEPNSDGGYTNTVTLFLPQGSDITLYFYVPEQFECTITAWFKDDAEQSETPPVFPYTEIAGVDEDGVLLTSSQT